MQDGARREIVASVVEEQEARTTLDVNRLLAVAVSAGVPADGNLGLYQQAAPSREARLGRDHQRGPRVLARAHPLQVLAARHARALVHGPLDLLGLREPGIVVIAHLVLLEASWAE